MTDHAAFLSAILADPADDTPRLIYAGWLEEMGWGDRAEFIRVQCELAKHGGRGIHGTLSHEEWQALRRRERELLIPNWHNWSGRFATYLVNFNEGDKGAIGVRFARGLLAEVQCTLQAWMGGKCNCENGERWGQVMLSRGSPNILPTYGGGYATCDICHGAGTIPGHGPAIVAAHPVERVVVSDRRPAEEDANEWYWLRQDFPIPNPESMPSLLPPAVFDLLNGGKLSIGGKVRFFHTEQAARDALECHALIAWAKAQKERVHG